MQANPGKISIAVGGNGGPPHLSGELFKMMTGIDMVHVPYRGGAPALTDLLGGQVHVMFDNLSTSLEFIKAGKVRPLAVTSAARSELLPELPTISEFLPGFEVGSWFGIGAPKGTPADIVEKLNKEINAGLADPKMKAQIADLSSVPLPMTPADFGKLIADETEKWGKVVKFAGIKPSSERLRQYSISPVPTPLLHCIVFFRRATAVGRKRASRALSEDWETRVSPMVSCQRDVPKSGEFNGSARAHGGQTVSQHHRFT
jgi:Tripartite tricarboxylate transporter family receptor